MCNRFIFVAEGNKDPVLKGNLRPDNSNRTHLSGREEPLDATAVVRLAREGLDFQTHQRSDVGAYPCCQRLQYTSR